jgi:hypothetical protein
MFSVKFSAKIQFYFQNKAACAYDVTNYIPWSDHGKAEIMKPIFQNLL